MLPVVAICLVLPLGVHAAEMAPSPGSIVLTVSQNGSALVQDRRPITAERGAGTLVFEAVARDALASSAMLTGTGLRVLEQGFDLDGLSPERLLAASVGREVTLVWQDGGGAERNERAKVLAARPQPLFLVAGKVVSGTPARILFDALPAGLRPGPAFRAAIEAEAAGPREVELTYRTTGLGWSSDASAELSADRMTLTLWASITNASGADYTDARLRLLAGSPNQAPEPDRAQPKVMRAMAMTAAPAAEPVREAVGPYHLYTVERPLTLRDGETRQVPLLSARSVPITRELVLEPQPVPVHQARQSDSRDLHPVQVIEFANTSANGLGKPLPGGVIRVGERGRDGRLVPLGEDLLPPLPEGRNGRISLGQAFDVTARRVQTDFQRLSPDSTETAQEVRLANGGDHAAPVTVIEALRADWTILEESQKHSRDSAATVRWRVDVPAKGEAVLRYRVRTKG
ncbi:hypothetical protein A6A04_05215 [Paramagnetospirillum marisnigri]|uniref:DUF4139 domain-containing protein n=1 Tax=Paramagnetospirillum marisnigri TaxID=1285242 RepID=A0A178MHW9_9PROT|nr:hypothetical protein A6A04_05215 [Paramagnetospirillum marisnigri]